MTQCQKFVSTDCELQQLLLVSLSATATGTRVILPHTETAAVSWRFLPLVAECSKLELLPLETPGHRWWTIVSSVHVTSCLWPASKDISLPYLTFSLAVVASSKYFWFVCCWTKFMVIIRHKLNN